MIFKPEDFKNADGEWINPMIAHEIANSILDRRPIHYVPIHLLQQMEKHKNDLEMLVRQLERDLERQKAWIENQRIVVK